MQAFLGVRGIRQASVSPRDDASSLLAGLLLPSTMLLTFGDGRGFFDYRGRRTPTQQLRNPPLDHLLDIAASMVLRKRVSKSRTLTHSGRTLVRSIWENVWRTPSTHSRPFCSTKYRRAQAAYSAVTPSTVPTSTVPRTSKAC